MQRKSKYWDDFEKRANETSMAILNNRPVQVRRVAVFITDRCNFKCGYCNHFQQKKTMTKETFKKILGKYGKEAIIHITGGEPSICKWLYPFLKQEKDKYRFHLNTNAYIMPPSKAVKRLKISLDGTKENEWNQLVGKKAFKVVCSNIKTVSKETVTSLTYTLNKLNIDKAVEFSRFCNKEFPDLYAIFFSIYKGNNEKFVILKEQADLFFEQIKNKLLTTLNKESKALLCETIDEKRRLLKGKRFSQSLETPCYLSMSERVFSPDGEEYNCSHLYRDRKYLKTVQKIQRCEYGCNQRLVEFNKEVELKITSNKALEQMCAPDVAYTAQL